MSVIHNTSKPESIMKKKSNSISSCYHFICESVAMGESLTGHVRSEENPADILCTKVIAGRTKRETLTRTILYTNAGEDVSDTIVYQPNNKRRKIGKSVEWSGALKG
jgi:hypothetical protein